jgi:hypothetical protein
MVTLHPTTRTKASKRCMEATATEPSTRTLIDHSFSLPRKQRGIGAATAATHIATKRHNTFKMSPQLVLLVPRDIIAIEYHTWPERILRSKSNG